MNIDILLPPSPINEVIHENPQYIPGNYLDNINSTVQNYNLKPSPRLSSTIRETPEETWRALKSLKTIKSFSDRISSGFQDMGSLNGSKLYNDVVNSPEIKKAEARKKSSAEFWKQVESQGKKATQTNSQGNNQGDQPKQNDQTSSQGETKQEEVFGALRDDGWSFEKLGKWMSENKLATGGLAAAGLLGTYYLWKKWRESKKLSEKDKEIARKLDQKSARNSGN